ncbi:MAG: hypothetical protein ACTSYK_05105 [Alphaproteobacteria bacterium]
MIHSVTPLADLFSCHPVNRANAMLREALLEPTSAAPDPAEVWGYSKLGLEQAPVEITDGPARHLLNRRNQRARFLFGQGKVLPARRLLTDLAARGDIDAAYELALTYD